MYVRCKTFVNVSTIKRRLGLYEADTQPYFFRVVRTVSATKSHCSTGTYMHHNQRDILSNKQVTCEVV